MTNEDRRLELLELFYDAWKRWIEDATDTTGQAMRELEEKLDQQEV